MAGVGNQGDDEGETIDIKDGFVYFGCKKSIKQHQQNLDKESTTIVSTYLIVAKSYHTQKSYFFFFTVT